jgi:hypothetical protein
MHQQLWGYKVEWKSVSRGTGGKKVEYHCFRGSDCDTDHYLVVAKLRDRILVSERIRQNFDLERFYLKKLDDVEIKEQYQVEISNRF